MRPVHFYTSRIFFSWCEYVLEGFTQTGGHTLKYLQFCSPTGTQPLLSPCLPVTPCRPKVAFLCTLLFSHLFCVCICNCRACYYYYIHACVYTTHWFPRIRLFMYCASWTLTCLHHTAMTQTSIVIICWYYLTLIHIISCPFFHKYRVC